MTSTSPMHTTGDGAFRTPRTGPVHWRSFAFPLVLSACLPIAPGSATLSAQQTADSGWVSLFNGHDLDGWIVKITGQEP